MSTLMEFWGVEVKSGKALKINPGDNKIVHLSQASLGEVKKDKGSESVCLYLNVNDKKLVLGTLSAQKFPQLSFDLVIEKDFELSHNWKNGSVYFTGYKVRTEEGTDDGDNSDSDEDVKDILQPVSNGNPELRAKPASGKPSASANKKNKKDVKSRQKTDDSDSDDSDLNASSSDDDETSDDENPNVVNRNSDSDESSEELDESDDEDSDESESDDEDEETPKKAESSKKRPAESASKTHVPDKKTKFITPQKTEARKGVSHTATPHPSKKSGKTPANSVQIKQQPQKSSDSFSCKSCNRSFTTEGGLQSHSKAKHSAAT